GKQGQWYKVEIGNQTGYIYQEYVGLDNSTVNNSPNTKTATSSTPYTTPHVDNMQNGTIPGGENISSNSSDKTNSPNNNNTIPSNTTNNLNNNSNSNKKLINDFTFYLATITKNCSLYDATPKYGGQVSMKLQKGLTIFVNPTSTVQQGWSLARLAVGAGYLPNSSYTENSSTKYVLEKVTTSTKLYSKPSKNSVTINLNPQTYKNSNIPSGTLVFAQQGSNLPNGWSSIFVGISGTQFQQAYVSTNILSIY
ncbi:MAG: hypothetical protein ACRDDL_06450, partial [Sarcina sp.]